MHAILPLSFCALRCLNSSLILYTYFGSVFKFLRFEHVRHQLSSTEFFIKKTFLGQSKYSIRYCIPQLPIKMESILFAIRRYEVRWFGGSRCILHVLWNQNAFQRIKIATNDRNRDETSIPIL